MPKTPLMRPRVAIAAGAIGLAVAVLLSGCTTNSTRPIDNYAGEPKGVEAPAQSAGGAPFAVWLKDGDQFTITLYGSSKCPPKATKFKLVGRNTMDVTVPAPTGKVCTMDYTPHTTVFQTPNTIDRHSKVTITAQKMRFTLAPLPSK